MRKKMRDLLDFLIYLFCGLPIIYAPDEDDPELWDNPKKKARIRRRMERRERKKRGKKADV